MVYEAEVKREEVNDGNRVLVVELKDVVDGEVEEYETHRTKVPMNATQKRVEKILEGLTTKKGVSKEMRNRMDEVREAGADPVGVTASENVDREEFVNRVVVHAEQGEEAPWDMVEREVEEKKRILEEDPSLDPEKDREKSLEELREQTDVDVPLK